MSQYLPVAALIVLAIAFCLLSFLASRLLAPRKPSIPKSEPYECGIVPGQDPPQRFPVTFFLVAMIFIVFDIEIIFLYPWAISHEGLGAFGFGAIVLFSVLLFESFLYLLGNGILDWGPAKRVRRADPSVSASRTSDTTVRRVGLEGRGEAPGEAERAA